MIISASRRTDIPAFFSEWFFHRLEEGFVHVRNPMNHHQVSRIELNPELVDCFVFWTKDPTPMLGGLDKLKDYRYYYHFTVNPYDTTLEVDVPKKRQLIASFKELSSFIGPERVIWRYNPVVVNEIWTVDYHMKYFHWLCKELSGSTKRCAVSFLEKYEKTKRNMKAIQTLELDDIMKLKLTMRFHEIAESYGIEVMTCCEGFDHTWTGITRMKCIDDELIRSVFDINLHADKDKNQRDVCQCVSSIDIGAYNTCLHDCLYCYANYSRETVLNNVRNHHKDGSLLVGHLRGDDKVTNRKMRSLIDPQQELFDRL